MTNEKLGFNKDKWLSTLTAGLFILGLVCVGYVLITNYMKKRQIAQYGNLDCVKESTLQTVNDEHMAGLIKPDSNVKILMNFYNCNTVNRGELVWFRFSEQITPVVRIVWGLPGDRYNLSEDPNTKGQWTIAINGEAVTAGSEPYYIKSSTVPPLKTYELSRNGILQEDEYILLSNKPPGLSDSSNLGLISKKSLAGKVVLTE